MADKQATFAIRVPTETNADATADSVEALQAAVKSSQDADKSYGASLRALRGSSDEVKSAKDKLKGAINAERDAISRNALALGKHGAGLTDVSKKSKEAASSFDSVKTGLSAAGGPASELTSKFGTLAGAMGTMGGAAGLAVGAIVAATAAVLALGTAVFVAGGHLAKFILESGNELRTMNLFREAATGSAANAKAFGTQIEDLADRVPTARKELNELSLSVSKAFVNTRVSGQGIVDTFNAVGQASSAMGEGAGAAIQGIIEKGKLFGRIGLGVNELQGTGLQFADVAESLAKNLKIGVGKAQRELLYGRVKVDDAAAALRTSVEKKFGKINLAMMLDLNTIAKKLKDSFQNLTKDVNLQPILEGFAKLAKLFDENTVTGLALKQIITTFGNTLTKVFVNNLPFVETFFKQIIIEGLKFEIFLLDVRDKIEDTFGIKFNKKMGDANSAVDAAKLTFKALAIAAGVTAIAVGLVIAPVIKIYDEVKNLMKLTEILFKSFGLQWDYVVALWKDSGKAMVDGLIDGLIAGQTRINKAVKGIADDVMAGFKNALGIHSPSKVFEGFGENTTEGFAKGVEGSRGRARAAVSEMVSTPKSSGEGGGIGGGNHFNITIAFPGMKGGADVAATVAGPSFRAQLQKALEEVLANMGGKPVTS